MNWLSDAPIPPLGLRRPPMLFGCRSTFPAICPRCHQYFDAVTLPLPQCDDCDQVDRDLAEFGMLK